MKERKLKLADSEAAGRHRDLSSRRSPPRKDHERDSRRRARARHPHARARAGAAERRSRRVRSLRLGRQERPASRPVAASRRRRLERARRTARVPIMKSSFRPALVNGPFQDCALYVALRWQGDALLFDLGRLDRLEPGELPPPLARVRLAHAHGSLHGLRSAAAPDVAARSRAHRLRSARSHRQHRRQARGLHVEPHRELPLPADRDRAPREPPRARRVPRLQRVRARAAARRPGPTGRAGRDARIPHRDGDTESPHSLPRLRRRRAAAFERADRRARGARVSTRARGCRA